MRTVIRRVGLIALGALFACIALETFLRVADPIPEVGNPDFNFVRADTYLGWSGQPNVRLRYRRPEFDTLVQHDADGWRQPEPPRPLGAARRMLVLGDSFTWGWGVSQGEVFTDHLQAAFPSIAIVNRGISGYGTAQEYLVLERELATNRYDTIILMFFINDLADNVDGKNGRRPYFDVVDGRLLPRNQPAVSLRRPVEEFFKLHSRAYVFLELELGLVKRYFAGEANDERLYSTEPAVDLHDVPGYPATAALLGAVNREARARGARFFLVYIPQRSEFEGDAPFPYVRVIHAMVDAIASREGFPVIDLAAPFRERAHAGASLVYVFDAHWTPAGHRLAADILLASPIFASAGDGVPVPLGQDASDVAIETRGADR
jgi:hypothetical protein